MGKPYQGFSEDFLICPLCSQHYRQPRLLPCLHSFCEECLGKHITAGAYSADRQTGVKGFPCPCCRKFVTLPSLGKTRPTKWPEEFPENVLIADLADIYTLRQGTRVCDPCSRNQMTSKVHSYCKNCRDALCERCMKTHRGLKMCKDHKVMSSSEFMAAINNLKVEEELCPKHTGKPFEQYCYKHARLCCASCIAEDHRKCDEVISVAEAAKKARETNDVSKLEDALDKYQKHLEIVLQNRSTQIRTLEQKKSKLIDEFTSIRKHIVSQLDKMESDLRKSLDQAHVQEIKKIRDEIEKCQEISSAVVNAGELLEVSDHNGADSQLMNMLERVRGECGFYEENIGIVCSRMRSVDYDIKLDKSLEHVVKKLDQFGRIDVTTTPAKLPPAPKVGLHTSTTRARAIKPTFTLTGKEATPIGEFNGRSTEDLHDCWFTGAQFMPDGRIVLVDRTNRKLKLFAKDYGLLMEATLSSRPWDVAVVNDKEVIVTLPEENRIQFVAVTKDSLAVMRYFGTDEACFGLHYVKENILALTYDGYPPNLKILNTSGEELTYVCVDDDGFLLFSKPLYVTSNSDGSQIFVTDERLGCVVCLTENGELNFTYSSMDLGHAAGLTLDREGNIYVCGNTSNSVHALSPNGDRIKVLVTGENISFPRAIAFEPVEKKLLVTQGDKEIVSVYSLA